MEISSQIKKILKKLPKSPGVYKMLNEDEKIIYIGKAKNLSKRVKQYFQKNYQHSSRTKKLIEKIADIKTITVDNELEATILELNLIKQLKPKYNVIMKDDKNFVYIKITKEDFPRIQIVREIKKDGAKYIGPKSAAHKVKETFKLLKKIFPFRHCGLDIKHTSKHEVEISRKVIKYPCLDYFIKRCAAPCIGKITPKEYQEIIKNIEDFLNGKADAILKDLKQKMQTHAKNKQFEKAAKIRDKLKKVSSILEKQKVASPNQTNQDVINYHVAFERAFFNLFQIRDGKLINQENFIAAAKGTPDNELDPEILEAFLKQYYNLATDIPKEILLPHEIHNPKETPAKITVPQKGNKNKLLEMSLKNAKIFADRNRTSWQEESEDTIKNAAQLQKLLKIKEKLKRIECYDISHLDGKDTVGSMIVFKNGAPKKDHYRKFKIRTLLEKADDYKCMEEVLVRRFQRIVNEIKHKDLKFRKAKKKDLEFIEKKAKKNKLKYETSETRSYYVLAKKTKKTETILAFASIKDHTEKIAELASLWVTEKKREEKLGYKMIKQIIEKTKSKRIYINCQTKLKDYYLLTGFEEIKSAPEEIESVKNTTSLAYDKLKHKKDKSFTQIPNLIVIDGGKGQLSVAKKVLTQFNLKIPLISLAKRLEEIFTPEKQTPILLPSNNEALKLLQRARDEAHRFAITYNKKLRSKKFLK